ncbi:hypothetical protein H8356DRAFT_1033568 [Neocallimastix lanati (nom. inval.)]|nr:hypothetical protein H8356DRAFT_1033568 [Neocallimastix sp. JGI-2020a]
MNGLPSNSGLSSNENFIKSQESLVQGAKRIPKPIDMLQTEFNNILQNYNATESAKINRKPIIMLNEEKYESNSNGENNKNPGGLKLKREVNRRKSKKTERKLEVREHEKALSDLKKFASIVGSMNNINNNKKAQSREVYDDDDDDEYNIFIGQSYSSNFSSRTNSSYTVNSSSAGGSKNNSNNSIAFVISPGSDSSLNINNLKQPKSNQQNLVIPNNPALAFNGLSANNANKDVYFSKEDVFKKIVNIDDEGQSTDSKKDEYDEEEKKITDKKKRTKLKQFLKLHKENCLLDMPNSLYTDIINESIKILTKTSQNYASQLGKKDESTLGSIKHLEHLKEMIPTGNQYQQHIDNNSGSYGPGYYQLCAPIDENGQYVQLKEKVLINSLESINSVK